MTRQIVLYDTTLRDGTQGEGLSFSVADKLKIARKLDDLGIQYIEGGWPGANPKDSEFFARAKSLTLDEARLCAFGSTRRAGGRAGDDPNLNALIEAQTPAICLVAKASLFQVRKMLETTAEENLAMIADSVAHCKAHGREVFLDAEHFFDGFFAHPDYALAALRTAAEAGADCLVLCDTNGGTLTDKLAAAVSRVCAALDVPIGIHTHNDADLAVANTLAAVAAGVGHVQGTINGYGERCGNANLCSIIPNLVLKMGIPCVGEQQLGKLTEVSHYISEGANLPPNIKLPYVGASAFAHKAGIHVNAVLKDSVSYEHIAPALVGNDRRVLVSELGGKSNVLHKARFFGLDLSNHSAKVRATVEAVKRLEAQGFQFENAEASFELLLRRAQDDYVPPFELLDFLVLVEKRIAKDILAEATVKIKVGDEIMHTAAEGNGPVNALDAAMRKALLRFYPELARVHLVDYKVRVLDNSSGTGAIVRVSIESSDGVHSWSTVGGSTNIIEASWWALADSLEYALSKWGL